MQTRRRVGDEVDVQKLPSFYAMQRYVVSKGNSGKMCIGVGREAGPSGVCNAFM
jgi:hypothetical protein